MKQKAFILGRGIFAQAIVPQVKKSYEILGFLNDAKDFTNGYPKIGNYNVYPLEKVKDMQYDKIIFGMGDRSNGFVDRLTIQLGVDTKKIDYNFLNIKNKVFALFKKLKNNPKDIFYRMRIKVINRYARSSFANKKYNKQGYNQISNQTAFDRYPAIFGFMKSTVKFDGIKILSFGCSTGEECFSIRKYFEKSKIAGYDISEANIAKARQKNKDSAIQFFNDLNKAGSEYDIVFAMDVLCRWPVLKCKEDSSDIYSFEQFNKSIELLDNHVKQNGYLVIFNANYCFTDTEVAKKYEPVTIPHFLTSGEHTKFSSNNRVLENQNYEYSVFKKVTEPRTAGRI
ncbi:hypothetical protein AGMMS49938_04420 [Fibrobacterales bacterium]|nr:hypothetical protein AGMMS49938_04420 [Fibrobacterales bacterium]